jgi:hypothetical protein
MDGRQPARGKWGTRGLGVAGIALWCALALPAAGTVVVEQTLETLARGSAAIVMGRVLAIESGRGASGEVNTYVRIAPDEIVTGWLPSGDVVLREAGGSLGGRHEWVIGSPTYVVGEQVVVLVEQSRDGALRTSGMAMGKYGIATGPDGVALATRRLGDGVASFEPSSGRLNSHPEPDVRRLDELLALLRSLSIPAGGGASDSPASMMPPELDSLTESESQASFEYTGARWFEPDDGTPIAFRVDATGDVSIGPTRSLAAIDEALAVWSTIPSSSIRLVDGGPMDPAPWKGCDAGNRIVFNDPFDEIDDPKACSGQLALGGICYFDFPTRAVNGVVFKRIFQGKVMFNNGLGGCPYWNECNLAEIAAHEIGHVIGLGHSEDRDATMYGVARFDGRCAGLGADDIAAARFLYPDGAGPITPDPQPSRTPTPTLVPTRTSTPTLTPTATVERRPIRIRGRVEYYGRGRVPVPGVTVEIRGSDRRTSTSDSLGSYGSGFVPSGTWQIEPAKRGGLGAAISALDAAEVLRMLSEGREPSPIERLACDVTGDGLVTALDAERILDFKVRALEQLPVVDRCGSDWAFLPNPAPAGSQLLLPPVTAGGCQPGSILLSSLASDAMDQNFIAVVLGDCTGNWRGEVSASEVSGEMRVRFAHRRGRGRRLQLPLLIDSGVPFRSVEGQLRYDPSELRPVRVRFMDRATRVGNRRLAWETPNDGQVRFALASAEPFEGRDAVLLAEFRVLPGGTHRAWVRPLGVIVDENPVGF